MKKIYYLYIAIALVAVIIVVSLIRKRITEQSIKNVIAPKPPVITKPPVVVVPTKTNPANFVLKDKIYAGEDLNVYSTEEIASGKTFYRKDEYIGLFISVRPSGNVQVSEAKTGQVGYILKGVKIYSKI